MCSLHEVIKGEQARVALNSRVTQHGGIREFLYSKAFKQKRKSEKRQYGRPSTEGRRNSPGSGSLITCSPRGKPRTSNRCPTSDGSSSGFSCELPISTAREIYVQTRRVDTLDSSLRKISKSDWYG